MSEEERTHQLRTFTEAELGTTNGTIATFTVQTTDNVERIDKGKKSLGENVNRIDKELSEFKNYCDQ
jgi:hypothetical protein